MVRTPHAGRRPYTRRAVNARPAAVMSRAAFLAATDELIATGDALAEHPDWDRFRDWLLVSDRLLERVWGRMDRYHLAWLNVGRGSAPPGAGRRTRRPSAGATTSASAWRRRSTDARLAPMLDDFQETSTNGRQRMTKTKYGLIAGLAGAAGGVTRGGGESGGGGLYPPAPGAPRTHCDAPSDDQPEQRSGDGKNDRFCFHEPGEGTLVNGTSCWNPPYEPCDLRISVCVEASPPAP